MNKENPRQSGYAAAALLRKQAAAAAANNGGPLPRVAVATGRSPTKSGKSNRTPKNVATQPSSSAAVSQVGIKPATHSTRNRVPLLDASSASANIPSHPISSSPDHVPSSKVAVTPVSHAPAAPAQHAPAASVLVVDADLDSEEQRLQQELAVYDQRLEQLQQQTHQRSCTPTTLPPYLAKFANTVAGASIGMSALPHGHTPDRAVSQLPPVLPPIGLASVCHSRAGSQASTPRLSQPPVGPPEDQSIVKAVITATGQGCKEILTTHAAAAPPAGACWTTRGHRVLHLESSCILQLWGRVNSDLTLRVTFAEAAAVPRIVRLEHAPTTSAAFEKLGDIKLQPKSLTQLRHLFRLGRKLEVQKYMRITFIGHMAEEYSGAHRVTHMLLTSSHGPQRTHSQASSSTETPSSATASVCQAAANRPRSLPSRLHQHFTADGPCDAAEHSKLLVSALSSAALAAVTQQSPAVGTAGQAAPGMPVAALDFGAAQVQGVPIPQASVSADSCGPRASEMAAAPVPLSPPKASAAPEGQQQQQQHPDAPIAVQAERQAESVAGQPAAMAAQAEQQAESVAGQPAAKAAQSEQQAESTPGQPAASRDSAKVQRPAPAPAGTDTADQQQQQLAHTTADAGMDKQQAQPAVWGLLDGVKADVDFKRLEEEFGSAKLGLQSPPETVMKAAAPRVILLPMERSNQVDLILSQLNLTPQQIKEAVLKLFDSERFAGAADLSEAQMADLLHCLPSEEERELLTGYTGQAKDLGRVEQFLLEMMQLPAVEEQLEAWRFSAQQFPTSAEAVEAAAVLLSTSCEEVQQSAVLQTLLKVAMLAGNFLSAGSKDGTAAGFQIDALLKLKEVRSTRARSRTLLHFVAREVARQHPEGACLKAALPRAAAAAQLNLPQAIMQLEQLTAGVRRVELAMASVQEYEAAEGDGSEAFVAYMTAFRGQALERLRSLQGQLEEAEVAFSQLGSFINGQRSTMANPNAFFGLLDAFAAELASAHAENAEADAAAAAAKSAALKDGKLRRPDSSAALAALDGPSPASQERLLRRRDDILANTSLNGQFKPGREALSLLSDKGSRGKQHSQDHSRPASSASSSVQQAQQGKLVASTTGRGAKRSVDGHAVRGSSPTDDVPTLLTTAKAARTEGAQQEQEQQEGEHWSTPVASLLAKTRQLISSLEYGPGGFGSEMAGSSSGGISDAVQGLVAASPQGADGAAAASTEAAQDAEADADACFSTPQRAVSSLHWQGQQVEGEGRQQHQGSPADGAATARQLRPRYAAGTGLSMEEEVPAGPAAAVALSAERKASSVGPKGSRGSQQLGQLRQRSLQQLSPTSTPLSSLGRLSSRSSLYSSSGGSTPASSVRVRSGRRHSALTPGGLGAAVAKAEAAAAGAGAGAGAGAADGTSPAADRQENSGRAVRGAAGPASLFSPELTTTPAELPAADVLSPPLSSGRPAAVPGQMPVAGDPTALATAPAAAAPAAAAAGYPPQQQQQQYQQQGPAALPASPSPPPAAAAAPGWQEQRQEREERLLEGQQMRASAGSAAGFGVLRSRAGSMDLSFYAPFSMDRQGHSADVEHQGEDHLSAVLAHGSTDAWGPLAQHHHQLRSSLTASLRMSSFDDMALPAPPPALAVAGEADLRSSMRRQAMSVPSSPGPSTLGPEAMAALVASRRPPRLDLSGIKEKLAAQDEARRAAKAAAAAAKKQGGGSNSGRPADGGGKRAKKQPQQQKQPGSPTLSRLLDSLPTARKSMPSDLSDRSPESLAGRGQLEGSIDIADLADCSSDQEEEWHQLQLIEQQEAEWRRQQAMEQDQREMLLMGGASAGPATARQQYQQHRPLSASAPLHQGHPPQDYYYQQQEQQQQQVGWASQEQLGQWLSHQEQVLLRQQWEAEEARQRALLQQLPSPINSRTGDLDGAMAQLLATAGNTPTGPLGQGVRDSKTFADMHQADVLRPASAAGGGSLPSSSRLALLEPVMPPPLGEGIRASKAMAAHIPAAALRMSVEGRMPLLAGHQTSLSLEAAAWAAQQQQQQQQQHDQRQWGRASAGSHY